MTEISSVAQLLYASSVLARASASAAAQTETALRTTTTTTIQTVHAAVVAVIA